MTDKEKLKRDCDKAAAILLHLESRMSQKTREDFHCLCESDPDPLKGFKLLLSAMQQCHD